jgi:polar amino acid transport system substrate-binding protein
MNRALLLLFSIYTMPVSSALAAETISLRADYWYPMNGDPSSDHPGYMIEIAKAILEPSGYAVDYETMPWKRALEEVRAGNVHCAVGAYQEDAPDFIFPNEEMGIDETHFYTTQESSWNFSGIESLQHVQLGYVGGYGYGDPLDSYLKDPANQSRIQALNADNALEQNIKKLLAGRIQATIESKMVMAAKLSDMGLGDNIRSAGALGNQSKMYIACSPKKSESKRITEMLGQGIIKMRTNGSLKPILEKYGISDWKQ